MHARISPPKHIVEALGERAFDTMDSNGDVGMIHRQRIQTSKALQESAPIETGEDLKRIYSQIDAEEMPHFRRDLAEYSRAEEEAALAVKLLAMTYEDPMIGYESANHYFYHRNHLLEKLVNCDYLMRTYGQGGETR